MSSGLAWYIAGWVIDMASTARFLRLGVGEGHPLWAWAIHRLGGAGALVVNACATALVGWLIWCYAYGPHEVLWAWIGLARCLVGVVNYTQVD